MAPEAAAMRIMRCTTGRSSRTRRRQRIVSCGTADMPRAARPHGACASGSATARTAHTGSVITTSKPSDSIPTPCARSSSPTRIRSESSSSGRPSPVGPAAPGTDAVKWRPAVGLILGAAVLTATLIYAGAGAVARTLEGLHLTGLLLIVLAHLPIITLMGLAWYLATGTTRIASARRFMWARQVRDAAAALPFSQVGGFVFGVRALRVSGSAALRGVLAMSVDLVIELGAKLPYVL